MLVVDDEPQIVRGLKVMLRKAGYDVQTAATKQEALDAVSVRPPDAMVLDLVLPDGSGVEVCEEVRRWSELPIIVLSAVGDEREKVRRARRRGRRLRDQALRHRRAARAAARGAAPPADSATTPVIEIGDLEIDLAGQRVQQRGARRCT